MKHRRELMRPGPALGVLVLPLSPEGEDWVAGPAATQLGSNHEAGAAACLALSFTRTAGTGDETSA